MKVEYRELSQELTEYKAGQSVYISIDLKSFFASVECKERGLDPLDTNLVVADSSRTEKTICLAVTPSLKSFGISGRARLFEVVQRVREVNIERKNKVKGRVLKGSSYSAKELLEHPELELGYIIAPPRMAKYMEYSTRIYNVYLKYIAPEDIHVYSIDEVFMDVTCYLKNYKMTPKQLAQKMIQDVYEETGITATAGIGTNMYLCKVAMDIVAKHVEPDEFGTRIGILDEYRYRKYLWSHKPLTDFWRVGRGISKKLMENGLFTMGDVARCSIGKERDYYNEDFLYKLFGVNAELLIDHAWGYEPTTIAAIRAYKPSSTSMCSGQVLHCPYSFEHTRLVVKEMIDMAALDLVEKGLLTNQVVLTIGYDIENLSNPDLAKQYNGEITVDFYHRKVPKHAHGTANIDRYTASTRLLTEAVLKLFDEIVNPVLMCRRISLSFNHLKTEAEILEKPVYEQLTLFTDYEQESRENDILEKQLKKERQIQEAMLSVKKKFGKNAIVKGMNLQEGATQMDRNAQIGGHKA